MALYAWNELGIPGEIITDILTKFCEHTQLDRESMMTLPLMEVPVDDPETFTAYTFFASPYERDDRRFLLQIGLQKKDFTFRRRHRVRPSTRIPGRFTLDEEDGPTLGSGQPVILEFGKYWVRGLIVTYPDEGYCFIPDNGDPYVRVPLRDGMQILSFETLTYREVDGKIVLSPE